MIDRLRSHLKNEKGFTLIELLVVIAIIAILVVIVIVAINPAKRLQEAADSASASNVRQAGTLVATCVTKQIQAGNTTSPEPYTTTTWVAGTGLGGCAQTASGGTLSQYGTVPTLGALGVNGVTFGIGTSNICVYSKGGSNYYMYTTATGSVSATPIASWSYTCP